MNGAEHNFCKSVLHTNNHQHINNITRKPQIMEDNPSHTKDQVQQEQRNVLCLPVTRPKIWSPWTAFLDIVSSKLAFYPPSPSTYGIVPGGTDGHARLHPDTCPTSSYTVNKIASPRGHLVTVRCTVMY